MRKFVKRFLGRNNKKYLIPLIFVLLMCMNIEDYAKGAVIIPSSVIAASKDKNYSGSIKSTSQRDWYKLERGTGDYYYTFNIENLECSRLCFCVYNSDGNVVKSFSEMSKLDSKSIGVKLPQNSDMYIVFNGLSEGKYKFSYTIDADASDNIQNAKTLSSGIETKEKLGYEGDVDYFKLETVDYTSYYSFILDNYGCSDVVFSVCSADGNTIDFLSFMNLNSTQEIRNIKVPKNVDVYLKVNGQWGATGLYGFKYAINSDIADYKEGAVFVEDGVKITDSVCTMNDEDWYRFNAKYDNPEIFLFNQGSTTSHIAIYDGDVLKYIMDAYYDNPTSVLKSNLKAGKDYYIKVYAYGAGKYSFLITDKYAGELERFITNANGWKYNMSYAFWYENGIRQGTYYDANGVIGDGTIRGREIYDPSSNGWYWLDAVYSGAKAVNKEVWMPYIYQNEKGWDNAEITMNARNSGDMANQVIESIKTGCGKWVRYDANGAMIKEWYTVSGEDTKLYPSQAGNTYYYDPMTGLMAKGTVIINGERCVFDNVTGALISGHGK